MNQLLTIPDANVTVREATLADVPFIDRLQKLHSKQVGFMRTSWIEAKIEKKQVIVAESIVERGGLIVEGTSQQTTFNDQPSRTPVGYCMGVDRYFKRDDVGIIHQMNVVPGRQRAFVGATLLRAMFERAAYGCRLFCCWCAQDLPANRFWESMGFVPLAYRAGSERVRMKDEGGRMKANAPLDSSFIPQPSSLFRGRVHIFWQKRIREGDDVTPWWFPAKTDAGAMGADRIVLPIPQGVHWSDEMPVILVPTSEVKSLKSEVKTPRKTSLPLDPPKPHGPRQFDAPPSKPAKPAAPAIPAAATTPEPVKREKKPKPKADPKMISAARELRDRWLEHVNSGQLLIESLPKYNVTRTLAAPEPIAAIEASPRLLPEAA